MEAPNGKVAHIYECKGELVLTKIRLGEQMETETLPCSTTGDLIQYYKQGLKRRLEREGYSVRLCCPD